MKIRPAAPAEVPILSTLFRETVLTHGPTFYSKAQTQAWAASGLDIVQFEQSILGVQTYVAETTTGIVGFGGLASDGRVASLYVRHDCLRQGIGAALLAQIIKQAQRDRLPRLYTEASEFSVGLFKRWGFRQYDEEVVERYGVTFTRYLLEKQVSESAPLPSH